MRLFNRLGCVVIAASLLVGAAGELSARTKKGDKLLKEGRKLQLQDLWDEALDIYEEALAEDPADAAYQMAVRGTRFQAAQSHVKKGKDLRKAGKYEQALAEFQRAYTIDPGSEIAEQELRRTYRIVKEMEDAKKEGAADDSGDDSTFLPEAVKALQAAQARMESMQPVPVLKPISRNLNTLKMNNQPVKVLFETVGKLAGINVVFDPEFQSTGKNLSVDLTNTTLEEALQYLSVLTKSYWKPLSENTIFVTNDNVTKRRDHEEMVVKVFYLENVTKVQELQEIVTAVRSVTDIRRMFTYNSQNAILVRGSTDQVALAEKLIADLDKPLAEVLVDVIIMEASRTKTRNLAASIQTAGKAGLSFPLVWNPNAAPAVPLPDGDTGGGSSGGVGSLPLGQLGNISINDWSTALPGFLLQALMTDRSTKILQRPQVRAADGQKASLRLGDRVPYATGSFQPGVGAVGVSPLVSTQFQFADTGVNVDLTPKIHGEDDVSMHIEIEISAVKERIDVGGLDQPIIGQRKMAEDIRVRDGEVTILGGLMQDQGTKTKGGVPGLNDIPIIKWLGFNEESKEQSESELLIAIIPHIVRRPDITELNQRGIAAGSDQVVRINYAPPEDEVEEAAVPVEESEESSEEAAVQEASAQSTDTEEQPPASEPTPTPAASAVLRFNTPAVQVGPGGSFNVSLLLENATDVYNAPMRFSYDPSVLRLNDVSRGSLLSGDGQQVIFTRNILQDSGTASVVLNRLPGVGGISGSGTLVTLTFQAIGEGTTQITVPEVTIRNSQMQAMPVTAPEITVTVQPAPGDLPPSPMQPPAPGSVSPPPGMVPGMPSPKPPVSGTGPAADSRPPVEDEPVAEVALSEPAKETVLEAGFVEIAPAHLALLPGPVPTVDIRLFVDELVGEPAPPEPTTDAALPAASAVEDEPVLLAQPSGPRYVLQIGAFSNYDWAKAVRERMKREVGVSRLAKISGDVPIWRVLVGEELSVADARLLAKRVPAEFGTGFVRRLNRSGEELEEEPDAPRPILPPGGVPRDAEYAGNR